MPVENLQISANFLYIHRNNPVHSCKNVVTNVLIELFIQISFYIEICTFEDKGEILLVKFRRSIGKKEKREKYKRKRARLRKVRLKYGILKIIKLLRDTKLQESNKIKN